MFQGKFQANKKGLSVPIPGVDLAPANNATLRIPADSRSGFVYTVEELNAARKLFSEAVTKLPMVNISAAAIDAFIGETKRHVVGAYEAEYAAWQEKSDQEKELLDPPRGFMTEMDKEAMNVKTPFNPFEFSGSDSLRGVWNDIHLSVGLTLLVGGMGTAKSGMLMNMIRGKSPLKCSRYSEPANFFITINWGEPVGDSLYPWMDVFAQALNCAFHVYALALETGKNPVIVVDSLKPFSHLEGAAMSGGASYDLLNALTVTTKAACECGVPIIASLNPGVTEDKMETQSQVLGLACTTVVMLTSPGRGKVSSRAFGYDRHWQGFNSPKPEESFGDEDAEVAGMTHSMPSILRTHLSPFSTQEVDKVITRQMSAVDSNK